MHQAAPSSVARPRARRPPTRSSTPTPALASNPMPSAPPAPAAPTPTAPAARSTATTCSSLTRSCSPPARPTTTPPEDYAAFSNGKTIDYTAGTTRFAPNILDQGMCGSCWTQAAATSIFGQIRKIKGANFPDQLLPSRQAIMDCAPGGDARGEGEVGRGCEGGNTPAALQWLQNVAIPTDTAYPYREVDHVCRIDQVPSDQVYPAGLITGVKIVPQYDEDALLHALETVGPISIVVCAGLEGFQGSNDRVQSTSKKCTDDQLDHAVTLVGAGVDGITGEEYWLVQNSWSYKWRDSGYIRIKRNAGNQYGVASLAAYPVLDASKIPFSTQ
ncbi:Papain family cysteine protease [Carpediemonas membranifera]|uniref:Papain family cysteine protease n=1 Tax=Carpediemonas membranifera TaxID=201153 RepID=A0A8J6AZS8_9EUKA|nr:Papain family cysteine protease [Carpediemonas membranifera]|eukprot:KAG9389849.1 Papain family cysteine protease [Carpediemonas membranifera]